jgi:hypothetical protein
MVPVPLQLQRAGTLPELDWAAFASQHSLCPILSDLHRTCGCCCLEHGDCRSPFRKWTRLALSCLTTLSLFVAEGIVLLDCPSDGDSETTVLLSA